MSIVLVNALYDFNLADPVNNYAFITKEKAEKLQQFFLRHPLFHWHHTHNFCEARAEAISLILTNWQVPHYKAWVFGGAFLYRNYVGGLKQFWNYHVAIVLPVKEQNELELFVLDPSTNNNLQLLSKWADEITDYPHSYYLIKDPNFYIFPNGKITRHNWHLRNKQNFKWVVQGLAGINGMTSAGKAQLIFNKQLLAAKSMAFMLSKKNKPSFLS